MGSIPALGQAQEPEQIAQGRHERRHIGQGRSIQHPVHPGRLIAEPASPIFPFASTTARYRPPRSCNAADAPVAQLDRALPSEGKGHTFESCRVRQRPNFWLNHLASLAGGAGHTLPNRRGTPALAIPV